MSQESAHERQNGPVILIGGASRAARALMNCLPLATTLPVVRRPTGVMGEIIVEAYDQVPTDASLSGATIVNCAGTPDGDVATLTRANCEVPLAWARRAAEEGAARFVQISSFSGFGAAHAVGSDAPTQPTGDYGRSKLAAEERLRECGLGDRLTILRVPILIGGGTDKLAQLVRLTCRTGVIPAAPWPTPRSMLSYDGLAATIAGLIAAGRGGTFAAADPLPYTPAMMRDAAQALALRARIVTMPSFVLALLRRAAPGLHASLFEPNLLAEKDNAAVAYLPFERTDEVVTRLLRQAGQVGGL